MLASLFLAITGLGLLFGPMWWLLYVHESIEKLAVITGSISVFSVWLWMAFDVEFARLAAGIGAYAAILVVYLQMDNS